MNNVKIIYGDIKRDDAIRRFNSLYSQAKDENANLIITKARPDFIEYVENFRQEPFERLQEDIDTSHIVIEGTTIGVFNNHHCEDISIMVISAGIADKTIQQEAELTIKAYGYTVNSIIDAGINDLDRTFNRVKPDGEECAIVSIQGFEGALAPILASHSCKPIISVPTSTGYGVAKDGTTALNTSLTSCTSGISVVNVNNGFGGAVCAVRIANQLERQP